MSQAFAGDGQHFESVIGPHRPLLLGLARKLCRNSGAADPEDLVQDTLERALRHFDQLREWSDSTRRAWLCTTLQRKFLDQCRRQRTENSEGPDLERVGAPVLVREPRAWRTWERVSDEELRWAITRLRPPLRTAFELHLAGLRYKAIAEKLGTTPGTVGFWLHQARRELKALLRPVAAAHAEEHAP
ncbi:RNA polymerase sigma factor [Archangium violaceum]|uniref:RNA polymerase sigma factor n=1 Tax=Archangium violaceum TaxID=83451 RepID=UPI00194F3494|nr:RNA polymerase sigma factor [Archangium violaceum]QRN98048.1 RNA polymerase sigma factor [Archangium violaceum]